MPSLAGAPVTVTVSPILKSVFLTPARRRVPGAAGKRVFRRLALRVLHIQIEVDMRVGPVDSREDAFHDERFAAVELRRERMVRQCRAATANPPMTASVTAHRARLVIVTSSLLDRMRAESAVAAFDCQAEEPVHPCDLPDASTVEMRV